MSTPSQTEIRTRTTIVRNEGDFIRVTVLPGAEESLADAQINAQAALTLNAGQRLPILVDMRKMKAQHRDARQHYGSLEVAQSVRVVALLVESRLSMIIANFFISISNTNVPTRIFTSEADALAWLKGSNV